MELCPHCGQVMPKTRYFVRWEIDIWADSPREAAIQALQIQRNPGSLATTFNVSRDAPDGTEVLERVDLGGDAPFNPDDDHSHVHVHNHYDMYDSEG